MRIKYRLVRATIVRADIIYGNKAPWSCPLALTLRRQGIMLDHNCGVHQDKDTTPHDVQLSPAAAEFVERYDSDHLGHDERYKERERLISECPIRVTVFVPEVRWQTHRK